MSHNVKNYLELDQDPETRHEILDLQAKGDWKALDERLSTRLKFGTAGLRAAIGAGYSRMNELTVIQATQGVAAYLLRVNSSASTMGVVIGHDHRHKSLDFAKVAANVFLSLGIKVYFYNELVHTPLVPFAVTELGAACGIMITASHNPKQDNGYKLYWSNGCQIISPIDSEIAELIEQNLKPKIWSKNLDNPLCNLEFTAELKRKYYEKLSTLSRFHQQNSSDHVKFCYSAMHGVGLEAATKAFNAFGLQPFVQVESQVTPDPDFPTVSFPNPEEKASLKLAIETADRNSCQIIIANDPDADRLAVAEKQSNGKWHIFTGNQIGQILASLIWSRTSKNGNYAMLASAVSSQLLAKMAEKENFKYVETLTGFKWLGNAALDLEAKGYKVIFAFEEAIGYMVGDLVKDKDGITSLAVFAEEALNLYRNGSNIYDYLIHVYSVYGYPVTNNSYFYCRDLTKIEPLFNAIRSTITSRIGNSKIVGIRDLSIGYDSSTADNVPTLPPSKEMITFRLENAWITLRTSGTEPKVKWYSEMFTFDGNSSELDELISEFIREVLALGDFGLEIKS